MNPFTQEQAAEADRLVSAQIARAPDPDPELVRVGLSSPARGRQVPPLGYTPSDTPARDPFEMVDDPQWHARRHDDIDGSKAAAVFSALLIGLAVGLLVGRLVWS